MLSDQDRRDLRFTVRDLLTRHSGEAEVRRVMSEEHGVDEPLTGRLLELGALAAVVPEESGGLGAGWSDVAVVLEETGRSLACVPLLSGLHGIAVLRETQRRAGTATATVSDLLGAVAAGEASLAMVPEDSRPGMMSAADVGGTWELHGTARYVLDGHRASHLLVPAATDRQGPGLFLVDAASPAVRRDVHGTLDQTRRLAGIAFAHSPVVPLAFGESAAAIVRGALDVARVALAVECVGGAEAVLAIAVEHARTRMQFGRPIGSFQAVKHHCADMLVQLELARTAATVACRALDDQTAVDGEREQAALLATVQCADAYYRCASLALQVLGGIGFTWEHPMHLYLKRASSAQQLFGDAAEARARLAARLDLVTPA